MPLRVPSRDPRLRHRARADWQMTLKEVATFLAGLSLGPFLLAVVNHFLGTRREKQQREREHYERYLAEAKAALNAYIGFVDGLNLGDPHPEEFEAIEAELEAAFNPQIAKAALAL